MKKIEFEHEGDKYEVACNYTSNKLGFKHSAYLYKNIHEKVCDGVHIQYYNRTWERYTYESVISKVLYKSNIFTDDEIRSILDKNLSFN
jgi:hypothetical protein